MCFWISAAALAIASSGDSMPANAAFTWVPKIVSTADHSDVRGLHSAGAASDAAMARRKRNCWFRAASGSTDLRNGIPPPSVYGFWTFALVAQRKLIRPALVLRG